MSDTTQDAETPTADAAATETPAAASDIPQEERTFGMLAHLAALSGFVIPFGSFIGPLVVWLIKKDTMPFVDEQGKESLNFQITATIAMLCCVPLFFVLIGLFLLPLIAVSTLVFTIIGAVKANEGVHYRYPFALRLIK